MIFLAAMLASGQVLPSIDRSWLDEQVRREARADGASRSPKPPLRLAPPAPGDYERRLTRYENTIGM